MSSPMCIIFSRKPRVFSSFGNQAKKPENYGKHMRLGPRADKAADKKRLRLLPINPLRNGCGLGEHPKPAIHDHLKTGQR